ncbi:MAG: SMEK domain-containing protein [Mediterranea sp.]|jgi:hypothetical protein|nr:SMEK domain-containing protein [Mediterranea sp.]
MNRSYYFNYIEERLDLLSLRIKRRGKLNLLELNIHSENFYRDLLNLLYGWDLENMNVAHQNEKAIDLMDANNKLVVQVSATNTKVKIQDSLSKLNFREYTFKFLSIAAESSDNLRKENYKIPEGIKFAPSDDILDVDSILRVVESLDIDKLKRLCDFVERELGCMDVLKINQSDLVTVIKLLAQNDLSNSEVSVSTQEDFQIESKINHNQLRISRAIISEHKVYQNMVNKVYSSFDEMGQNKSLFVLNKIRKVYIQGRDSRYGDELFGWITDTIMQEVAKRMDGENLSIEAIEMYVDILIVDAFIRCKIFENPNNHVTA